LPDKTRNVAEGKPASGGGVNHEQKMGIDWAHTPEICHEMTDVVEEDAVDSASW